VTTERQLRYWQDSETLFGHALAVTTDNAIAHVNLGVAFEQQSRREEAMREYKEGLRLNPGLAQAHNNLANLLAAAGKSEEALAQYREGLRLRPRAALAHLNLGTLLVKLGQFDEAISHYEEAARLRPDDPRPERLMAQARLRQGRDAEALAHFRAALSRDANDVPALTGLARGLAADEDPRLRDATEALALAERANALTGGNQPFVLDTLAMAYAEVGRFNDARQMVRQALDRVSASAEPKAVAAMQARLRLYESNQPYRGPLTEGETNATGR
jgi:tetratricopeptide (TPR) repeat protein